MNYTELSTCISIYFKEIKNFSSMTPNDERILFARYHAGDKSAETEIYNRMAKLAVAEAKTYTGRAELLQDLIQEANMGILIAIPKFDITKGYRFSSFAKWWIKARICEYLDTLGLVHAPDAKITGTANRIRREFYNREGRDISKYELLDLLEAAGETVTNPDCLDPIYVDSLDQIIGDDDDDRTLADTSGVALATADFNAYNDQVAKESLHDDVMRLLDRLSPRERRIVMMKSGLGNYRYPMGFDDIAKAETARLRKEGKDKSLSPERVRQLYQQALKTMKG